MILITGATGTIGTEVTRLLAQAGVPARAMTRDPARAGGTAVPAVRGDFEDPRSLEAAAAGARAALLLTGFGPRLAEHDRAFVAAAEKAGVETIVKISAIGAQDTGDPGDVASLHAAGERAVTGSRAAWTILRPSMFATNALAWADIVKAGQPIPNMTGAGRQGIVDPRDIAALAVAALTGSGHEGRIYEVTGPDLLTVADQAELIGKAIGRRVETVDVPIERAAAQIPDAAYARAAAKGWAFIASGGNAVVTTAVRDVLGREARGFGQWAEENKAAFQNNVG